MAHADTIYRRAYENSRRAVPGVITIIQALKKTMKIAVVTNGLVVEQDAKIKLCGLEGWFDEIVIAECAVVKKPQKEIFQIALSALEVSPDEAVVIGDSWKLDVLGARNAGIPAVWFNRYEEKCPEPGLAVEITSLEPTENLVRILSEFGRG